MSKTYEHFKEADEILLEKTERQILDCFGTFNEYLRALAQYSHPQHNIAVAIREQRKRPYYHDQETTQIGVALDRQLSEIAENFGRKRL